jgi:hypothetical protein
MYAFSKKLGACCANLIAWILLGCVTLGASPKKQPSAPAQKEKPSTTPAVVDPGAPQSASEPQEPISFAGIWMAGPEQDWQRRFPIGKDLVMTRRTISEESAKSFELSKQLLGDLRRFQKQNPGGNRIVDALAEEGYQPKAERGSALVMACVLNYEYCFTRKVGRSLIQKFAEVSFDLVICDFSSLSVVATFPYRIERIGSSSDREADMLRQIYLGFENEKLTFGTPNPTFQNKYKDNIPGGALVEARPATLREAFLNMAKTPVRGIGFEKAAVRKVSVRDDARNALDPYFKPIAEEYFASMFSSNFCEGTTLRVKNPQESDKLKRRYEYGGTGVACLPFSKGNEVVYSMLVDELADAFRVRLRARNEADSKNVAFSLGRPLYDINLVIPGFQTNPIPSGVQYCAYSRIELTIDGQTFYSKQHDGNDIFSSGAERTWAQYAAATNTMFFEAGHQILKAVGGSEIQRENPIQIVKTSPLRKFFLMCAPDCSKSFTQKK